MQSVSFKTVHSSSDGKPVQMKHIVGRARLRAEKHLSSDTQPHGPRVAHELRKGHGGGRGDRKPVGITDAVTLHVIDIGLGHPPQIFKVVLDTGSSFTWIGGNDSKYHRTSSSQDLRKKFQDKYGTGSVAGEAYTDILTLAPQLVIRKQLFGVANKVEGIPFQGIMGLGPDDLTEGIVEDTSSVPTIMDNMLKQGTIKEDTFGVFFAPTSKDSQNLANGEISFGFVDEARLTTPLKYVPITTTYPSSHYWGVDLTSIKYGDMTLLSKGTGIADTGTSVITFPTDIFEKYKKATGAVTDEATGMLTVTLEQYNSMANLQFQIGDEIYIMNPNAQIFSRSISEELGGEAGKIYLVAVDFGSHSGSGLDVIIGQPFLARYYTQYDTANLQVGFAETEFTFANTN